jgi:ParB/RepB/Spo0J family partition protein
MISAVGLASRYPYPRTPLPQESHRLGLEDSALKELAESLRTQDVLSPLLVRPLTDQSFEIVAGARRYRAAQMAEALTVPVRIVNLTGAGARGAASRVICSPQVFLY